MKYLQRLPLIITLLAALAHAQTIFPGVRLQGNLFDVSGNPVSGDVTYTVLFYNVPVGGSPLYMETFVKTLAEGIVNDVIGIGRGTATGDLVAAILANPGGLYLTMKVGTDPEALPRQLVTAGMFSVAAATSADAQKLGGFDAALFVRQDPSGQVAVTGSGTFQSGAAGTIPFVAQGASGQTANLAEFRDSSGNVVASVGPSGVLTGSGAGLTSVPATSLMCSDVQTIALQCLPATVPNLGATNVFAPAGDATGVVVRQSASAGPGTNVFAVQNASGSTTFFAVNGSGTPTWSGVAQGSIAGNGSGLTNLNPAALSGPVPSSLGGTGINASAAAAGAILVANGAGAFATLPKGLDNQVLKVVSGDVTWAADEVGTGGGGDAQTLDGIDSPSFCRVDAASAFSSGVATTFNNSPSFARAGAAPFSVSNADTATNKVVNLNADRLDGLDSSNFSQTGHMHSFLDMSDTLQSSQLSGSYSINPVTFGNITSATVNTSLTMSNLSSLTLGTSTTLTLNGTTTISGAGSFSGGRFNSGTFSGTHSGTFSGDGSGLTSIGGFETRAPEKGCAILLVGGATHVFCRTKPESKFTDCTPDGTEKSCGQNAECAPFCLDGNNPTQFATIAGVFTQLKPSTDGSLRVQLRQQVLICNVGSTNGAPVLATIQLELVGSAGTQIISQGSASNYTLIAVTTRQWQYISQPTLGGVGAVKSESHTAITRATLDTAFRDNAFCFLGGSETKDPNDAAATEKGIQLQLSPTRSSL